jgi:hypothetical protein
MLSTTLIFCKKEAAMTEIIQDIREKKAKDMEKINKENNLFSKRIARLSTLACNRCDGDDFDYVKAQNDAQSALKVLCAKGGIQEMLVAQMLSIHRLQQLAIGLANEPAPIETARYFTNTAIKLANVFVQQANLLNKLQGNAGQKIIVERVDVHSGGQAVVGNINRRGGRVVKNENDLM